MDKYEAVVSYYDTRKGTLGELSIPFTMAHHQRVARVHIRPTENDVVRVRFSPGGSTYSYLCKKARVGDWVIVPPNKLCINRQIVQVVAVGYSGRFRAHRQAQLITKGMLGVVTFEPEAHGSDTSVFQCHHDT